MLVTWVTHVTAGITHVLSQGLPMLPVTCMCYPSALVVVCFWYHRCNPWGVTRVAMPLSKSTLSLVTPCVTFHVTPSPSHFVSSYPIVAWRTVMHAQSLPSLPCKKHNCAVGQLFLLRSSFQFSMPLVGTTTRGVPMNIAKSTLEPSAPFLYFASASGTYKQRRVHSVPQGDKNHLAEVVRSKPGRRI